MYLGIARQAFAAQRAAEQAGRRGMDMGMRQVDVLIRGPGAGREAAIRSLQGGGSDGDQYQRCDTDPPQRLPAPQTKKSIRHRNYG